ncbi:MAG TPA: hypothetical protein VH083_07590 [Myxococcales bacterium]|jgi:hypothetical protein|nr:hypothetical protein [Myxococcales bacterium]
MIAAALIALLASTQVLGPDMFEVDWIRPGGKVRLLRELLPDGPPGPAELIALAADESRAAIREEGGFRVLPGETRIPKARAAAFSPDGQRIAAALQSGEIVATDLNGESRQPLGHLRGAERLAWSKGVVAAGKGGARLLPDRTLTEQPVRALAAVGDRIAIVTPAALLLFDGAGKLLLRLRVRASALALSAGGSVAWSVGREVWLMDAAMKPKRLAREHESIHQIVFAGEEPVWVADGARRAGGGKLDCARSLDSARGVMATCSDRVVNWQDPEHALYEMGDCFVTLRWAVPLGDGLLVASTLRDRRFSAPCGKPAF